MEQIKLKDSEFGLFQDLIYETAGIKMTAAKKNLVSGRLAKRVIHFGFKSYEEYFEYINAKGNSELQNAIDLLTTNETFFFREPKHFDFLLDQVFPFWPQREQKRIWSAASSTGEEAYTLAILMAEHTRLTDWEILGTDISTRVLEKARSGHYPLERSKSIPKKYLTNYCLKGTGSQSGTFIIGKELRKRVRFSHANLRSDLSAMGRFDIIFLRNVMIYFDVPVKKDVVARLIRQLKPGGYLMIGHSESLNGITDEVQMIQPSIYRKI